MSILAPPFTARANRGLVFRPDASTVLWLPGQDDAYSSTLRDRSGNGNDGTITGATWKRNSQGLWYLDFDGASSKVDCGDVATLQFTDRFSFECWLIEESIKGGSHRGIVGKTTAIGGDGWGISYYDIIGGALRLYVESDFTLSWEAISPNTWYHVVGTFDKDLGSNQIKLYVNGSVARQGTKATTMTDVATNFTIGSHTGAYWSDGPLTLARAYNISLSAEVIKSHYNQERHLFGV